jgi:hypothetical protein
MSLDKMRLRVTLLGAFLCLSGLFVAAPAFSQGCAMCSSYVEASSKGGQKAVNRGVLLLLIPAAGVMSVGTAAAYRYSRKRDMEQADREVLSLKL